MSIYDQRLRSAYRSVGATPADAKNPLILSWWTSEHDALLEHLIGRFHWAWHWAVADEVVASTPAHILEEWRRADPRCRERAWYNVLMRFAAARADVCGLTLSIRKPETRTCLLCAERFVEDSLPMPLVERLGIDLLEFCAPCLRDTVLRGTGDSSLSADAIGVYLRQLANVLGRVPPQGFGEGAADLRELASEERVAVLRLLRGKPNVRRVKELFGSWLNALIRAGVLDDGSRRTGRGVQTVAKDGHVCLSLGERTICDFLSARHIPHEKEPRYPDSHYRGDFRIGNTIIEYLGLAGNPAYDAKTKDKVRLCKSHGLGLVLVQPKDLISRVALERKLSLLLVTEHK
jgi:hypothetical protein